MHAFNDVVVRRAPSARLTRSTLLQQIHSKQSLLNCYARAARSSVLVVQQAAMCVERYQSQAVDSAAFASSLSCFAFVSAAVHAGELARQLVLEG